MFKWGSSTGVWTWPQVATATLTGKGSSPQLRLFKKLTPAL